MEESPPILEVMMKRIKDLADGRIGHEIGALTTKGVKVVKAEQGFILCEMIVHSGLLDENGNCHVGAIAVLVDTVANVASISFNLHHHVTLDFSISYYSTAKFQEEVEVEAKVVAKKDELKSLTVQVRKKAIEALARVATLGLIPNMVLYLMGSYNLHLAEATVILLLSVATSNFTPIIGAFIADSYLGHFLVVGLGSIFSFLGIALLWITTMIPQTRPPPCNSATETCKSATNWQMAMLIFSLTLIAIGNGGLNWFHEFGLDQVKRKYNINNHYSLGKFFRWHNAMLAISVTIAFTLIVYIQDHFGWKLGFGIPAALLFLSTFLFFLASPLYVKNKAHGSSLNGVARVIIAAYKNRKLRLPAPKNNTAGMSNLLAPTDKLRFLNKACFDKDQENVLASDGSILNPRSLCTIDQVEGVKAIIKVIPLWSTGIMIYLNTGGSFELLQAKSMNRHIIRNFEVPAGSFTAIRMFTIFIWIPLYDHIVIPLASRLRGKHVRINSKRMMELGLFSFLHLVTAANVETIRRRRAIAVGYINTAESDAVLNMSAMWLLPQLCFAGIAEAFSAIGQNEFYFTEFPKSVASIALFLSGLGKAAGYLVSSLVFVIVEKVTWRARNDGMDFG